MKLLDKIIYKILSPLTNEVIKLRQEVIEIKKMLNKSVNPKEDWLESNSAERMDANDENLFDEKRRKFHKMRYEFASQYVNGKSVADIACGTGYGSNILRKLGNAKLVLGIDIDTKTIDYASSKYGWENVEFKCNSADNVEIEDESFDVIVSFETIEHVDNDEKLLSEFHRLLKPNGILIISTPNNWPLEISKFHKKVYDFDSFNVLLSNFIRIDKFYNQNSGSDWFYNHGQLPGIVETTDENAHLAECYIVVGAKISS